MSDLMIDRRLDCAKQALAKSGDLIEKLKFNIRILRIKEADDLVTNGDIESEKIIISQIQSLFPDDGIIPEESVEIKSKNGISWYVDPIDGTKDFVRDIPAYRTSLSCETMEKQLVTGVYYPYLKTIYLASNNGLVTKNKQTLKVSNLDIDQSFVYFYPPNNKLPRPESKHIWQVLQALETKVLRLRGDSNVLNALVWIANGGVEGLISLYSNHCFHWRDVAPAILMVKNAGGKVTDIYGKPIINRDLSKGIVASNGKIHEQLLEVINRSV